MKHPKNVLTVTLILSSIALLLVFQIFWLSSAYNKAFDDLRKETGMLFRSTVFAMHDSLIQRNIETLPGDSLPRKHFRFRTEDSLPFEAHFPDSLEMRAHFREETARIQVLVSPNENDSTRQAIKPMVSRFFRNRGQGNYILRLRQDSLKIDSIGYHFKNALSTAGIDLPFRVVHVRRGEKLLMGNDSFATEPVRINPVNRYAATFSNVQGLLFREIIPQILFSIFLTILTTGSFYMMYRSLLAQRKMAELKNDFISNVTHELKTPITTVGVALEALRNFKGLENPQLTHEYLDIAQYELNRLTILTDKVLKTAIFEKNGVTFQSEKVDLEKLVEQVLTSMKLVFERSQSDVTFNKEGTGFSVFGGADHLTNIVHNLLDNAMKYSPGKAKIVLTLKDSTDKVVLSVQDHGQGIAPEYHKKIFEKFFRVPTGDIHNVKGYGLGLSYVANVIHRHRGTISVESSPGKGSCFVVTLPKHEKN